MFEIGRRTKRQRLAELPRSHGISLNRANGNGYEKDKKNGLINGDNNNGKPDVLTFVQAGHFNFRLTRGDGRLSRQS